MCWVQPSRYGKQEYNRLYTSLEGVYQCGRWLSTARRLTGQSKKQVAPACPPNVALSTATQLLHNALKPTVQLGEKEARVVR